ncbi:GNAT family N-acetyltransferase [Dyadobacter aurulentus]|uniref:GNAT family N-acetyltransferase n=1 Tax=Dyadobacter sp. UC 10 TaxID=2605428 RepID=UPI0011F3432F|nr:GNAT family N-acetyltransferase [Dyadobacter sp. UC 10]KAA0992818.1 GNAT family N-acetyltransferase [Dyadobacter sp. UC 10]
MEHILDNPVWHALETENGHLGHISGAAACFAPAVSPFVALAELTPENLLNLYLAVPFDNTVILVSNTKMSIGGPWANVLRIPGHQMLFQEEYPQAAEGGEPVALEEKHVPQMLALTQLTNPGPFLPRTIDFGHYEGIFNDSQLISMAGQRLHVPGFAEISAVCTDPGYLGKGFARQLVMRQVRRIMDASEIPFLHVKANNLRAIQVYESLGFKFRTEIHFYALTKKS